MGLNIEKKQGVVSKINKVMKDSLSVVVASLDGIPSNDIAILRNICRKRNVYVCVVRNTLIRRAFQNSIFESLRKVLVGSNIVAFSIVEANDCVKIFSDFSKEHIKFKIKGAVFEGMFIDESKIGWLSSLPNYKECVLNLIFVIRECVLGNFLRILHMLYEHKKYEK